MLCGHHPRMNSAARIEAGREERSKNNPKSFSGTAHTQCAIITGAALVQFNHMPVLSTLIVEDETAHELRTFSAAAAPYDTGRELNPAFDLA